MSRVGIEKIVELRNKLVESFVQREEAVSAILSGLLTRRPVLLIGDVGTAKTKLIFTTAMLIKGEIFDIHLDPETDLDQILGPIDIEAYRKGEFRRITEGYLPKSDIVLIHEVFRGSRSVRDALLDILERGYYKENNRLIKVRAIGFFFDTNFVSDDIEDKAFIDRCTIRCFVNYVTEDAWGELIEKAIGLEQIEDNVEAIMTVEEIKALQEATKQRFLTMPKRKELLNRYFEALGRLKQRGVEVSDRMKVRILHVTSAVSLLYLEKDISLDSLAEALRYCVPLDEEQKSIVEQVIMECKLSSVAEHIEKLQAMTTELGNVMSLLKQSPSIENLKALNTVKNKVLLELKRIPKNPRLLPYVRRLIPQINECVALLQKYQKELFGE